MKCLLEEVPNSTQPSPNPRDQRPRRNVRCLRPTCYFHEHYLTTPDVFADIDCDCQGQPLLHEWREWWNLFSEVVGLDEAAKRVQFIRWRAKGSPLDQLPPGVPPPQLPPKNAGLSDAEVAELLPGESDPTLIGNRIAALTTALGIPPCDACGQRQEWFNAAHRWLRGEPPLQPPPGQG